MITRTRDYLARVMAPKMGLTHQNSRRYLDLFLEEITEALKQGNEVVFRGFGRQGGKKKDEQRNISKEHGSTFYWIW